ncbi:MAG: hypothetical protein EBR49_01070 [Betaproteobacteria bacterium]|nr:hypothetical protein [Betaproteobacteria bacterium]
MNAAMNPMEMGSNTDGESIQQPIPADRGAALMQALEAFDDDFADLLVADQKATLPLQGAAPANPKCSSD